MKENRKLAYIVKIDDIQPIPNSDNIELAYVKGWRVVVKKNDFNVGDLAIYFEIDSMIPATTPSFEFLHKYCYNKRHDCFRIKTIKLRGTISQGLLTPLNDTPLAGLELGTDLTAEFNLRTYDDLTDEYVQKNFKSLKPFPYFLERTDQERIQNIPEFFENKCTYLYDITVKLDGMSTCIFKKDGKIGVCSKNYEVTNEDSIYHKTLRKEGLFDFIEKYDGDVAIFGETIGEGIQNNRAEIKGQEFYAFDIRKPKEGFNKWQSIDFDGFYIKRVPIKLFGYESFDSIDEFIELSKGSNIISDTMREGIVVTVKDITIEHNKIISFKVINPDYLLKHNI